ncbi:MAG: YncE family protein [Bacteroidota bacterium]|nr:YncE family protein [Bacteroidota bacterium]
MKKTLFTISFVLIICMPSLNAQSNYKIANKYHVEGNGGWDYLTVDESSGRIFMSHSTVVNVVNENDGKLLGTIPDTKGVHGIAIAADLNKAFISNGADSSVTIVDLKSLAFIAKVSVTGKNPDAILYDPFSHKVFTYNGRTSNATVIDGATNKVVATIKLDGKPEFSVTDGKGKVYVNIEDKSEITCINSSTLKVEQTWSIAPGEEPSGLALDNENHRLFAVCGNKMMVVVDAMSGKVITNLPTGNGTDGAAFDPALKRAYSSNGEGTMTVVQEVNPNEFKVLENVPTQQGARTITVDKKTHHLFLPTAEFGPAPAATADNPRPRPTVKPDTFTLLDIAPVK